jgi:hypothetical protein
VVFASKASDLVNNDTNGSSDIFVRDRQQNLTLLASRSQLDPVPGHGSSHRSIIGADGHSVLYCSLASDLTAQDFNNQQDLFLLRWSSDDSDLDGLDDDWELVYFGTLTRNGLGDFDSDGSSDGQEFQAGTDPINSGSVLRVITVTLLGGETRIFWAATPGKSYQVQFKDDVTDDPWADLPGIVTASSSTAMGVDSSSRPHRFYRVALAQ